LLFKKYKALINFRLICSDCNLINKIKIKYKRNHQKIFCLLTGYAIIRIFIDNDKYSAGNPAMLLMAFSLINFLLATSYAIIGLLVDKYSAGYAIIGLFTDMYSAG